MESIIRAFIDLIFPPVCAVCKKPCQKAICDDCYGNITYLEPPICSVCGSPGHENICFECSHSLVPFKKAVSAMRYEGTAKEAIHAFKFCGKKGLSEIFGQILYRFLASSDMDIKDMSAIVPVPLSDQRRKERGFNQSEEVAVELSKLTSIPIAQNMLIKIKDTKPQFKLDRAHRLVNEVGAYKCQFDLEGRDILLIDDIYTTGATVKEASKALKLAGAGDIYVLTLARAIVPGGMSSSSLHG